MYSWGSARGSARPTACPPCRGRFSRGDRGTLRPRPPLEEAASSEEAGREAGRQQGKSQRRLASKAAESRARRAFIARGGGGGEEEEGGPTCGSGGPRSGAGTARRRGAERGLHPGGLGPEQPAPPRGYRPAVGCLGVPLLPPRCGLHAGSGREGRGGMLCVSLPPFGYRFSSTHRRCGVSRCLLGAAVSGLGCGRFGCGRTCATLMISLQALRIPTAMCPRAWHKAGVSQEGEFGGKWDLTLG